MIAAALYSLFVASAKGAVAALAVLALRAAAGRRLPPRWSVALWSIVAVRLVLPVGPSSEWSLFGGEELAGATRLGPWIGADGPTGAVPVGTGGGAAETGAAYRLGRLAERAGAALRPSSESAGALAILWAAGVLVVASRGARGRRRLADLRSRARPVTHPGALRVFSTCRRALGLRDRVALAESPDLAGPALCPGGPGTVALVLLPPGDAERLALARLRHILLHELAHLAHGDLTVRRLAAALCAIHWFNPLVHLAARTLAADQEIAADARAVRALGRGARGDYAGTLLALLPRTPAAVHSAPAAFTTNRRHLHRRIAMIASFRPRRGATAAAALAFALISTLLLTDSAPAGPGTAPPVAPESDALELQIRAVDDIRTLGRALWAWSEDHPGESAWSDREADAPFEWSSCPAIGHDELTALLVPRYAEALPEVDPWGRPYDLCLDREGSESSYRLGVRSAGSDGRVDGRYVGGPFIPDRTTEDLVWIDGYFVRWPEKDPAPAL